MLLLKIVVKVFTLLIQSDYHVEKLAAVLVAGSVKEDIEDKLSMAQSYSNRFIAE